MRSYLGPLVGVVAAVILTVTPLHSWVVEFTRAFVDGLLGMPSWYRMAVGSVLGICSVVAAISIWVAKRKEAKEDL